ncbi:MAG: hypothetical protein AAGJ35_07620, partial [Myxococcota bacterium]
MIHSPKLHLTKKGSLLRFRWFAGGRQAPMEFRRELSEQDNNTLQKMMGWVQDSVGVHRNQKSRSLEEMGKALYQILMPSELRPLLKQNQKSLAICGGDPLFPWEILHDGDDFLGLRFPLGRLPSWAETQECFTENLHGVNSEELHVVMLSDLLGGLTIAKRETEVIS